MVVAVERPRSTMGPKGIVSVGRLVSIPCSNGIQSQLGDLEVLHAQMVVSIGRLRSIAWYSQLGDLEVLHAQLVVSVCAHLCFTGSLRW